VIGAGEIPFEEIARFPAPGTAVPVQASFSPGDRCLTYLYDPDGGINRSLWALDLDDAAAGPARVDLRGGGGATSEVSLSLEERLRRERAREVGLGVTSASWAAEADVLVVPLPSGVHVVEGLAAGSPRVRLVVPADAGAIVGPKPSPDGRFLAFVRAGELHVVALHAAGGELQRAAPKRLTFTATDGLANGVAEFVAQEEMARPDGYWWSRDSKWLAYAEVDERHIPVYRIVHQGSDSVGPDAEEDHRYPFAGKANAVVRLGVVPAGGGATVWMQTGDPDAYLARVHWMRDGRLVAELEARSQTTLEVVAFDPSTGEPTLLHCERTEPWINLHDDFRELPDGAWLWSSERTGYRHLEVRERDGALRTALTSGDWQVDALEGVDSDRGLAFFSGTRDGATQRHLYAVSLSGDGPAVRLSEAPGTHGVVMGRTGCVFVDRHGSRHSPYTVVVRRLELAPGQAAAAPPVVSVLHDRRDPRIDELGLLPPELITIQGDDGGELRGCFYEPEAAPGVTPPLVVWVYGGPHAQHAVDDWLVTAQLRAQALRRLGCAVMLVDNRGTARRGLAFEAAISRHLGTVEVADQVAAVRWATDSGRADPERVAIYGWSYGGYMALRCLELAPEVFRAGVAGAPVTHWDGYDTHYTERYMGMPEENAAAYDDTSALAHVDRISGELLIVHGLIDENVHFRHSARLINRLIAEKKPYTLLCFPDERHLPRRLEDRAYMEEQIITWITTALGVASR
jgi:dipeptidyl-peptidase-4